MSIQNTEFLFEFLNFEYTNCILYFMEDEIKKTDYVSETKKTRVSDFVASILNIDAQSFGFIRSNNDSNLNGLINKLLPTMLEVKKLERSRIIAAANKFNPKDAKKLSDFSEIVFDSVYFSDADLEDLSVDIHIRPNKNNLNVFDEIIKSELPKAAVDLATYIRNLLNRYALLPQFKREQIVFDAELETFGLACEKGRVIHFRHDGKIKSVFAYTRVCDCGYEQKNYLICYDLDDKKIRAYPVCEISKPKVTRDSYHPSKKLVDSLAGYVESCDFEAEIEFMEDD